MPYLITSILLAALSVTNITSPSRLQAAQQRVKVVLTPFNLRGTPVRIITAEAKDSVGAFEIEYSMTNVGTEPVVGVHLRIFIADSTGKIIRVRDAFSSERIEVGLTVIDQSDIRGNLKQSTTLFVAVNKVVTVSGVWLVEDAALASAIKSKLNNQPDNGPPINFESNVTTSEEDRSQIFELILHDILRHKEKVDMLKNPSKVLFLRDSVSFNLPQISSARLLALDKKEIQALADAEGETAFMVYEPLTSEGSQVFAEIALRRAVPRRPPKIYVASSYVFRFVCAKENGRWVIQDFVGMARSGGLGLP